MSERPNKYAVQVFVEEGKVNYERQGFKKPEELLSEVRSALQTEKSPEMIALYRQFISEYEKSMSVTREAKDQLLSESRSWAHMGDLDKAVNTNLAGLSEPQIEAINQFALIEYGRQRTNNELGADTRTMVQLEKWFTLYKSRPSQNVAKPTNNSVSEADRAILDSFRGATITFDEKPVTIKTANNSHITVVFPDGSKLSISLKKEGPLYRLNESDLDISDTGTGSSRVITVKPKRSAPAPASSPAPAPTPSPSSSAAPVAPNPAAAASSPASVTERSGDDGTPPRPKARPKAKSSGAHMSKPPKTISPSRTPEEVTTGNAEFIKKNQSGIDAAIDTLQNKDKKAKMKSWIANPTNANIRLLQEEVGAKMDGDFRGITLKALLDWGTPEKREEPPTPLEPLIGPSKQVAPLMEALVSHGYKPENHEEKPDAKNTPIISDSYIKDGESTYSITHQGGKIVSIKKGDTLLVPETPIKRQGTYTFTEVAGTSGKYTGELNSQDKPDGVGTLATRRGNTVLRYSGRFDGAGNSMYPKGDVTLVIEDDSEKALGTARGMMKEDGKFVDGVRMIRPGKPPLVMRNGEWEVVAPAPAPAPVPKDRWETVGFVKEKDGVYSQGDLYFSINQTDTTLCILTAAPGKSPELIKYNRVNITDDTVAKLKSLGVKKVTTVQGNQRATLSL